MSRRSISSDGDDNAVNNHEAIPLDMAASDLTTTERIIEAFKAEIISSSQNNISQLLMTLSSGMYVIMTTREDGPVHWLSLILSIFIFINVISLLVLIWFRKKKFKTEDGQCPVETMNRASRLHKVYSGLSILLIVLQFFFTVVTGVSVSRAMDGHSQTIHQLETNTMGEYVVNSTSG